jgi:hypothetical protein
MVYQCYLLHCDIGGRSPWAVVEAWTDTKSVKSATRRQIMSFRCRSELGPARISQRILGTFSVTFYTKNLRIVLAIQVFVTSTCGSNARLVKSPLVTIITSITTFRQK